MGELESFLEGIVADSLMRREQMSDPDGKLDLCKVQVLWEAHAVKWADDRKTIIMVIPFLFTTAIVVAHCGEVHTGYSDRWCFKTVDQAMEEFARWGGDGEPEGWHRHPDSGRRREGGDPAKEIIRR